MSKTIIIDPITRISGFLDINVEVEQNTIVNAKTNGLLYRGFEKMLKNRSPFDAIYFTERICGICSTAHAMASATALEDAINIAVDINDLYLRDIIHGFEFIQNHLRQFYLLTVPSYVKLPDIKPISPQEYSDFRLTQQLNNKISQSYLENIEYSRLAHEGLAVLGGKAPHNHGIFTGGVTVDIDSYKIEKVKSIIQKLKSFIAKNMLEDMNIIAEYYNDYFEKGRSYFNFMSYGLFDKFSDIELNYVKPSVIVQGKRDTFNVSEITENIRYSWYINEDANASKKDAYTFIKAPRYGGEPMEVGPLARMILSGEYTGGNSCMDRNMARVLETIKIISIMEKFIDRVEIKPSNQRIYEVPVSAMGIGLVDTTRGALGHWIQIENKVISHYDIITPSGWNLSPRDDKGIAGVGEKSLIGLKVKNIDEPVEIGRIIRSFDPCVSCATHVTGSGFEPLEVNIL